MALTSCGQVRYQLKTPYRDGTTRLVIEPLDLMARLAGLVPPPRMHLTRYHGVFAPRSKLRAAVTPAHRGIGAPQRTGPVTDSVQPPTPRHVAMSWARRLKRVFGIEIEDCARCGGKLRVIASIEEPEVWLATTISAGGDDHSFRSRAFILDPDGELVAPIVYQAVLQRRHQDAIRMLESLIERDEAGGSIGRTSIDLNINAGDLRRLSGDAQGAAIQYRAALDELRLELAKQPDSADIHSYLALAYRGLGERAQAVKYATLAVNAVPVAKDAFSGAYYLDVQARVWASFGDRDAAMPAIEALMKLPTPLPLTPALLRLDPDFDRLRVDPRFKAFSSQ